VANNIQLEVKADSFRTNQGIGTKDPVRLRSLLSHLNVITIYKPLSGNFSGMAIKINDDKNEPIRFMLINSSHSIGKQHFTICHELYHLYIQDKFTSMSCQTGRYDKKDKEEYNADVFASYLLLPEYGVKSLIPLEELRKDKIKLQTVIKLEQYFSCSRSAILYRLKELSIITSKKYNEYKDNVKRSAIQHGYSKSLYEPGNQNLAIGDYGTLARLLYEKEKISQTKYLSLLLELGMNAEEVENLFDGQ